MSMHRSPDHHWHPGFAAGVEVVRNGDTQLGVELALRLGPASVRAPAMASRLFARFGSCSAVRGRAHSVACSSASGDCRLARTSAVQPVTTTGSAPEYDGHESRVRLSTLGEPYDVR